MKFRYKLLAVFMGLVTTVNMVTTAFADNPLQLTDRLTQDAEAERLRNEEIGNKRLQQQSTKNSFIDYGTALQGNDSIAFYINRKNMTKKEYDAFKWSFIFSQFAEPLKDGLLDVFNQQVFREMIEKDFNIESIKTTLTNSQLNPNTDTVLQAMLDDANFTELEDTIRENYAYYYLHDGNGNAATLGRLVNTVDSKVDPLGVVYYIYDTQIGAVSGQEDLANALLYNQHILGDNSVKLDSVINEPVTTEVPVFTVTSQVFLYLQLAVASYLMNEDCQFTDATTLVSYWGESPLVIDSYGNVCMMDSGKPVILVPNFGNPFLTASYSKNGEYTNTTDEKTILRERVDFYNSWITSFYTRNQRVNTKIYNTNEDFTVVGDIKGDIYSQLVSLPSTGKTAGAIALVEASDVYSPALFGRGCNANNTTEIEDLKNLWYKTSDYDVVDKTYKAVLPFLRRSHDACTYAYTKQAKGFLSFIGNWGTGCNAKRFDGYLVSPVNTHFNEGAFAPFTAPAVTENDTLTKVYTNPNPLVIGNVDINRYDIAEDTGRRTCYSYLIKNCLDNKPRVATHVDSNTRGESGYITAPLYTGSSNKSSWSTANEVIINPNVLLFVPACFNKGNVLHNPAFVTDPEELSNGITREMYTLPKDAVDVGQFMDAYISDEKGMLLASYKKFLSGSTDSLKHFIKTIGNCIFGNKGSSDDVLVSWSAEDIKKLLGSDPTASGEVKLVVGNMDDKYSQFTENDSEYNFSFQTTWNPPRDVDGRIYTFFDTNATGDGDWNDNCEAIKSNISNADIDPTTRTTAYLQAIGITMYQLGNGDKTSDEIQEVLHSMCTLIKWDYDEFITFIAMYAPLWSDDTHVKNDGQNTYFFDQYWYYLRNTANLSDSIHAEANKDTFASVTYYWDRYYLLNTAFNVSVGEDLMNAWETSSDKSGGKLMEDYEKYLSDTGKSKSEVSLSKYRDELWSGDKNNLNSTQKLGTYRVYHPSVYEATLQLKTFDEYKAGSPVDYIKFKDASQWYDYLTDDTVIVYPFGHDKKYYVRTYYGMHDTTARDLLIGQSLINEDSSTAAIKVYLSTYKDEELYNRDTKIDEKHETDNLDLTIKDVTVDAAGIIEVEFNPISLMLSLQKNTDTEHNDVVAAYKPVKNESQVTKEELMSKAGKFFSNPVTSISYIITGFLYKVHDAIATGNMGNVFSITWLLETKPYKWIINRYVALMTLALVVLLFLKMTQLLMSKTHDFSTIGKSVVGILAIGIVPVLILNSFVWVFTATSKWALGDSYNKVLLSQVERQAANANNDAAVDAELTAFKEQFSNLSGDYSGAAFELLIGYNAATGATYKTESLDTVVEHTRYNTSYDSWYKGKGFEAVHIKRYSESLYYYFYDYIRCAYFDYCKSHKSNSSISGASTFIDEIYKAANVSNLKSDTEAQKKIQAAENGFRTLNGGGFREMLYDTSYVYGPSADSNMKYKYGGPCVKDLVGLYNIFRNESDSTGNKAIDDSLSRKNNVYLQAYAYDKNMTADDRPVPSTWLQNDIISDYASNNFDSTKRSALVTSTGADPVYPVFTSKLDAFNSALNPQCGNLVASYDEIPLTPIEEKLCKLSEDIYETTLKCLEYLPGQVHDESAITMMAIIATFKTNQLFGVEPQGAIIDTITLDSVVRAAFVTDLMEISSSSHTLYAMVEQGDSVGKIALVVVLELIICISSIARVAIVLYLTIATFVVLALRLLNKTPKTTDLIYGVVGNLLALLFLHALTLFLVVIAVEWVANATSAIPGLALDIAMIIFVIFMVKLLIKLVKNIVLDAINMGGTMFKNVTHKIANSIVNAFGKLTHRGDVALAGANVSMTGARVSETLEEDKAQRRAEEAASRLRTEQVVRSIERIETEEAASRSSNILSSRDTTKDSGHELAEQASTDLTEQVKQTAQREAGVTDSSEDNGNTGE